jgi:hypothetical protein
MILLNNKKKVHCNILSYTVTLQSDFSTLLIEAGGIAFGRASDYSGPINSFTAGPSVAATNY